MNCKYEHLNKIENLNKYFSALEEHNEDTILCIAVCDEASKHFDKIYLGPYADDVIDDLGFREGFAAIVDKSSNKNVWKRGKEVSVDYEYNGHKFGAHSMGFLNLSNKGYAYFKIDGVKHKLYKNRGINLCLYSKSENKIVDLLSIDTFANLTLKISRFSKNDMIRKIDKSGIDAFFNVPYEVLLLFCKENYDYSKPYFDEIIEKYRILARNNQELKKHLISLLKLRNNSSDRKEIFEINWHLAQNGNKSSMKYLISAYRRGIDTEKNIDIAIVWNERLSFSSEKELHEYVDLLLTSDQEINYKKAYDVCFEQSKKSDGWFRDMLVRMIWNGVGTKKDRTRAKKIMKRCRTFIRDTAAPLVFQIPSMIYKYDNVYLWGLSDSSLNIHCACIQNNLQLRGIIDDGKNCDKTIPTHLDMIPLNKFDYSGNNAILLDNTMLSDFDHVLPSNYELVIASEEPDDRYKILFEPNGDLNLFEEYIIVCDQIQRHENIIRAAPCISSKKHISLSPFEIDIHNDIRKDNEIKNRAYIISSVQYQNTYNCLIRKGIPRHQIYLDVHPINTTKGYILPTGTSVRTVQLIDEHTFNLLLGKRIYEKIPRDCNAYMSFFEALGDQYHTLSRTKTHSAFCGLKKPMVLVNKRGKDLPNLFGYDGFVLSNPNYRSLIDYVHFNKLYGNDDKDVTLWGPRRILREGKAHLRIPLGQSRESSYWFLSQSRVPLNAPHDPIRYPRPILKPEGYQDYCGAVLINPYGNHMQRDPDYISNATDLFERLTIKLNQEGIRVYTNSMGNHQPPIKGSEAFWSSISELMSVCREFRSIVTIYTGLMEALILTDANLCVLTPQVSTTRQGMADANRKKNYKELVLDIQDIDYTVDKVFNEVMHSIPLNNERISIDDYVSEATDVRLEDCITEYIGLCDEYPRWREKIFRQMFLGLDDIELESAVNKVKNYSKNNKSAMFLISRTYDEGICVDADSKKAIKMMRSAVLNGADWATIDLLEMLLRSGDLEYQKEVSSLTTKLMGTDDGETLKRLGRAYREGKDVEKNLVEALECMSKDTDRKIKRASDKLSAVIAEIDESEQR